MRTTHGRIPISLDAVSATSSAERASLPKNKSIELGRVVKAQTGRTTYCCLGFHPKSRRLGRQSAQVAGAACTVPSQDETYSFCCLQCKWSGSDRSHWSSTCWLSWRRWPGPPPERLLKNLWTGVQLFPNFCLYWPNKHARETLWRHCHSVFVSSFIRPRGSSDPCKARSSGKNKDRYFPSDVSVHTKSTYLN
jgi:hypothetical protein